MGFHRHRTARFPHVTACKRTIRGAAWHRAQRFRVDSCAMIERDRDGGTASDGDGGGSGESHDERLNRELIELANELRVALPGVQVLFAFLLTIPFTGQSFRQLSSLDRAVYFSTFCATMAATVFLMLPTAYHRLRWRRRDKERMLRASNRAAITGLVFLSFAICGAAYLIADLVYPGGGSAAITVVVTAALIAGLWFVLPLSREATDRQD